MVSVMEPGFGEEDTDAYQPEVMVRGGDGAGGAQKPIMGCHIATTFRRGINSRFLDN